MSGDPCPCPPMGLRPHQGKSWIRHCKWYESADYKAEILDAGLCNNFLVLNLGPTLFDGPEHMARLVSNKGREAQRTQTIQYPGTVDFLLGSHWILPCRMAIYQVWSYKREVSWAFASCHNYFISLDNKSPF